MLLFKTGRPYKCKLDDFEKLRPEELNQQNIEALVAESNLKMEILPVNDLDIALHEFVNKDDKLAFHACVQRNLDETRRKISQELGSRKCEEDNVVVRVGECLEEHIKESATRPKETFTFSARLEELRSKGTRGSIKEVSFSDDDGGDEDTQTSGFKCTGQRRKRASAGRPASQDASRPGKACTSVKTRGSGRGKNATNMKQTTVDASLGFRCSQRSASVTASASVQQIAEQENTDSASSDECERHEVHKVNGTSGDDERVPGKSAAPRGRGRGSSQQCKRQRKLGSSSLQRMLTSKDE